MPFIKHSKPSVFGVFLGHKKSLQKIEGFGFSDPEGIRTPDPQIRNLLLYPAELRDLV